MKYVVIRYGNNIKYPTSASRMAEIVEAMCPIEAIKNSNHNTQLIESEKNNVVITSKRTNHCNGKTVDSGEVKYDNNVVLLSFPLYSNQDPNISLNELTRICHQDAVDKGFWDSERNKGELIALMHSELSEALEDLRDNKEPLYLDENGKPCGVLSELADTVIRIMDFCGHEKYDLEKAILEKLEYNKTRPYKHNRNF